MLEPNDDVRFVIVVSTIAPNRNWFLLATRNEFILLRAAPWRLRPVQVTRRFPRGVLRSRLTLTGRRVIELCGVDYYVSRIQLREVALQNDDYLARRARDAAAADVPTVPRERAKPVPRAVRRRRPRATARSAAFERELAELREIIQDLRDGLAGGGPAGARR